jgi:hypothetical protein
VAAGQRLGARGELGSRVEGVQQRVELDERGRHREGLAGRAADRVAGEVPAGVAAEVADGEALVAARLDERAGVPLHDRDDLADRRRPADRSPGEGVGQVAEQPRPAEAPAPDHDAVAAGLGHHPQRVVGGPDVAVAEHRHAGQLGLEPGDRRPVGAAAVELLGRAGVQRDGRDALVLRPATGLEVGEVLVVDARAHLHGHRHRRRRRARPSGRGCRTAPGGRAAPSHRRGG